jgi:predicted MFS family arabinose efflux permease
MRSRAAIAIFLLGAGAFWNAGNIAPIAAQLSHHFSITLGTVGLLSGTALFTVMTVGSLAVPGMTRSLGAIPTARIACVLGAAGNVILALAPAFWVLMVGRIVASAGVALVLVIGPAIARSEGGVKTLSVFGASVMLGVAAALGIGGLLVDAGANWRVAFALSALLAVAALPFLPERVEVTPPGHFPPGIVRRLIDSAPEWRLLLLFAGVAGIPLVVSAWLSHYLTSAGGLTPGLAGILAFLLFGISAVIRVSSGRLAARGFSPVVLAGVAPLVGSVGMVLMAVEPSLAGALPGVVLMGVGFALPYAVMYDEAERLFPEAPVASLSFLSSGANVIPIVAIPLVGAALEHGSGEVAMLALSAVVVLAGAANLRPAARPATGGDERT